VRVKLHWLLALGTGAILAVAACGSSSGGASAGPQGDDGGTPLPGDDASPGMDAQTPLDGSGSGDAPADHHGDAGNAEASTP